MACPSNVVVLMCGERIKLADRSTHFKRNSNCINGQKILNVFGNKLAQGLHLRKKIREEMTFVVLLTKKQNQNCVRGTIHSILFGIFFYRSYFLREFFFVEYTSTAVGQVCLKKIELC